MASSGYSIPSLLPWQQDEPHPLYVYLYLYRSPGDEQPIARMSIDQLVSTGWFYWRVELRPARPLDTDEPCFAADMAISFERAERAVMAALSDLLNGRHPSYLQPSSPGRLPDALQEG